MPALEKLITHHLHGRSLRLVVSLRCGHSARAPPELITQSPSKFLFIFFFVCFIFPSLSPQIAAAEYAGPVFFFKFFSFSFSRFGATTEGPLERPSRCLSARLAAETPPFKQTRR